MIQLFNVSTPNFWVASIFLYQFCPPFFPGKSVAFRFASCVGRVGTHQHDMELSELRKIKGLFRSKQALKVCIKIKLAFFFLLAFSYFLYVVQIILNWVMTYAPN